MFLSTCAYLYKEQRLQGSCCAPVEAVSSSTLGLLCFSDGTAARPSCSGARPPADIYSPSPVDLGTGRRKQMLRHPETSISSSSRNSAQVYHPSFDVTKQEKQQKNSKTMQQDKGSWTDLFGCSRRDTPVGTRVRLPADFWTAEIGWFPMDHSERKRKKR